MNIRSGSLVKVATCALLLLALAAGPLRGMTAQAADSGPSMRYVFAHRVLPQLAHQMPHLGLALALSPEKDELLATMWKHCQEQYPNIAPQTPKGLSTSYRTAPDQTILLLVTMPKPEQLTEAYYVCMIIAYSFTENKEIQVTDLAYYTLEKSVDFTGLISPKDGETKEEAYTVLGGWSKAGGHANYGRGPSPDDPDAFIYAAKDLFLRGKK